MFKKNKFDIVVIDLIEITDIPDTWTKEQIKVYEIYSKYADDDTEMRGELERLLAKWFDESQLKIVSWNCNGKFREKFTEIIEEDADIYVIQECEDPSQSSEEEYREFAGENYIWTGHLHYKDDWCLTKVHSILPPTKSLQLQSCPRFS